MMCSREENADTSIMSVERGVDGALRHGVVLGVDDVLLGVVLIHDAEGVQAHFQLHGFPAYALVAQALDEGGREVQAGRGRGGRAFAA